MKSLTNYLSEKLVINKNYTDAYNYHPTTRKELDAAIQEHYDNGIYDLNDIDVSEILNFSSIFMGDGNTSNENFDVSNWDVSNAKDFSYMFYGCEKFICNLSNWDVSNGENFSLMFYWCKNFNSDLVKWNVGKGENFEGMFEECGIDDKNKPKGIE